MERRHSTAPIIREGRFQKTENRLKTSILLRKLKDVPHWTQSPFIVLLPLPYPQCLAQAAAVDNYHLQLTNTRQSSSPRNLPISPETPRLPANIPNRQHHWSLGPLIRRLGTPPFRHVCNHPSGTTHIDQHVPLLLPLLPIRLLHFLGQPHRRLRYPRLTHAIGITPPPLLFMRAPLHCRGKLIHQCRNIINHFGGVKFLLNDR